MTTQSPSLLVIGAHPDDAEFHAGGLAARCSSLGRRVKLISVTDGGAGHHTRTRDELVAIRKQEAADAGAVLGAPYEVWSFPDGELVPSLEVRSRIIQEIREFRPDLVLTHRICDYHPDHRAVGQAVQDASYMVTVPGVLRQVPPLSKDPVVAYLPDMFTKPYPLQADVVVDIADQVATVTRALGCQQSQVFEWLPFEEGILDEVPDDNDKRLAWLQQWYLQKIRPRADRFRSAVLATFGESMGRKMEFVEVFEISEYARQPEQSELPLLFPG